VHVEEFSNLVPIGGGTGGTTLVAAGIAVDAQGERGVHPMNQLCIGIDALD
jgi:hypothetical protein